MMNRQLFRALSLATRNVPSVPRLFPCQHTIQCHRNIVSQRLCLPNSVHLNLMHANTPKHKLKFFITRENNLVSLTCTVRWMSDNKKSDQSHGSTFRRNPGTGENDYSFLLYGLAISITFLGLSYLAVPLYRMFCQAVGLGGTAYRSHDTEKVKNMEMVNREIVVTFNADKSAKLKWNFRPQQHHVKVKLGETALAFYTAENPTDKPVIGISSYSIDPPPAGPYFNKIQCFCFEEQMLKPHEKVDLPVFFYIDPDYDDDIMLENINEIGLSYTFFPAKRGVNLPGYQMNTLQYGVKLKPQEEKQTT